MFPGTSSLFNRISGIEFVEPTDERLASVVDGVGVSKLLFELFWLSSGSTLSVCVRGLFPFFWPKKLLIVDSGWFPLASPIVDI